ncbi:MAG: SUMF1/EgtB/PvdO family nonheme iron enzyme [Planctomycetes bacterium]|nr:SUMF1/EgtB/PvdO family nonheme iron enzyme [Planctomycetota bacterium]
MAIRKWLVGMVVLTLSEATALADVLSIDTVLVGNPGNAADDTGAGVVDHAYNIGMYEVTAAEYTAFLNAVAAENDTYGLYNTQMSAFNQGCNIQRSVSSGSYVYSVAADRANRPVNFVSWGDAARFANWLHNGQPTGAQDNNTTEDGAYELNGATSQSALMAITRQNDARWFLPTANEWYKAAYYDGVDSVYYNYPMGTDAVPNNGNPGGDTGNTANYGDSDGNFTVGSPYWSTPVGHFGLSDSPYGTFDQGGNVWEWNESADGGRQGRGVRGGSWGDGLDGLLASYGRGYDPTFESNIGFRVASSEPIPEPSTIVGLISMGLVGLAIAWRRRKRK